jgi:hypothetical protein
VRRGHYELATETPRLLSVATAFVAIAQPIQSWVRYGASVPTKPGKATAPFGIPRQAQPESLSVCGLPSTPQRRIGVNFGVTVTTAHLAVLCCQQTTQPWNVGPLSLVVRSLVAGCRDPAWTNDPLV